MRPDAAMIFQHIAHKPVIGRVSRVLQIDTVMPNQTSRCRPTHSRYIDAERDLGPHPFHDIAEADTLDH